MSALARFVTVLVGAAAFGLMGVLLGAWWAPFVGGLAAGAFLAKGRWAAVAGAVSGLIAWTIPLAYAQLQFGLQGTSTSLAAIMGFNGAATVPIALTLLTGTLLGFSGAWFGAVARSLVPAPRPASGARPARAAREKPPAVKTPS